jgi:spore maturation protein CgeB
MNNRTSHNAPIAIVGGVGGTNVGESLKRASRKLGHEILFFNQRESMSDIRPLQSAFWRLCGKRPVYLNRFSRRIVASCPTARPATLIATGAAPLTAFSLRALKAAGLRTVNYSTDDPWNSDPWNSIAAWHLHALPEYDTVFTPRRSNINDLRALGCRDVRYLPFGYDEDLFFPSANAGDAVPHPVLFVGGADYDRVDFFNEFMRSGLTPAFAGGYWNRYPRTCNFALGHKPPEDLRQLTASAIVNICLVRRANRDGHVMRSFEIPAVAGFMIAEDTAEHRDIFGEEGQCVLYFTTPEEAAKKAAWAIANKGERRRMVKAAHDLIVMGRNTYKDRLEAILERQ